MEENMTNEGLYRGLARGKGAVDEVPWKDLDGLVLERSLHTGIRDGGPKHSRMSRRICILPSLTDAVSLSPSP